MIQDLISFLDKSVVNFLAADTVVRALEADSFQRLDTREFNFRVAEQNDSTVLLQLPISTGATWGIRYTLSPDNYLLHTEIVQQGMALALPASTASIDFQWHQTMARNEKGRTFEERNSGIHYKYVGDSPDDLTATSDETEALNNRVKWVAFKN